MLWRLALSVIAVVGLFVGSFQALSAEPAGPAATFTVNSTNDVDDGTCNATHCSLREAINATNNNGSQATDSIFFAIPGAGVQTIVPTSAYPALLTPVVINGLTQPGASCTNWPPTLLIELNGAQAGLNVGGLSLQGSGSTIRGLVVNGFSSIGLAIQGPDISVTCNFVGTNAAGIAAVPNGSETGGFGGIYVGSVGAVIGGNTATASNLISGNKPHGIALYGTTNRIERNWIGTDVTGAQAIPNGYAPGAGGGIAVGGNSNTIGGSSVATRNVISNNYGAGVKVYSGSTNIIEGNTISKNQGNGILFQGNGASNMVRGNTIVSNADVGVLLYFAPGQIVGGGVSGAANTIQLNKTGIQISYSSSGSVIEGNFVANNEDGIVLYNTASNAIGGVGSAGNTIQNNLHDGIFIGAQVTNTLVLGNQIAANQDAGINVNSPNQMIGGTAVGAGNTIHSNPVGIYVDRVTGITIQGNTIRSNQQSGIELYEAPNNQIGTPQVGGGNILISNTVGISIRLSTGNLVQGNELRGNTNTGVVLEGSPNTQIGGATSSAGNTFTDNEAGIMINNYTTATQVRRNSFTDNTVAINVYGNNNTIGGENAGEGNLISESDQRGMVVAGQSNDIVGNTISASGEANILLGGQNNNIVENSLTGGSIGILLSGSDSSGNRIQGNTVTFNGKGIWAWGAVNNLIGGTGAGEGNIVKHSAWQGVIIDNGGTGNRVLRNSIDGNNGRGIHLDDAAPTVNDPGDGDTGNNTLQNYPVLSAAESDADATEIRGTFNSTPNTTFRLEFFTGPTCHSSGYGQGATYRTAHTVTTDANGNATLGFTFISPVPVGHLLTSTATNLSTNNTSEFSVCQPVANGCALAGDLNADHAVTVLDVALIAGRWEQSVEAYEQDNTGVISIIDIMKVASKWGAQCPSS